MLAFLLVGLFMAPSATPDLRISELMASNTTSLFDEDADTPDWIELHNAGAEAVDLTGYALSNSLDEPGEWTFPGITLSAGARLIVYASGKNRRGDHLHTSFRLSASGEAVMLTDGTGSVVDSISFGPLPGDISFGRSASDPEAWRYFEAPTPLYANGEGYLGIMEPPVLGAPPGRYEEPLAVSVSSPDPEATLHYTLDGAVPTPSDTRITGLVEFADNGVLRVRAFRPGYIASSTATATYLLRDETHLPVFALVVEPDRLWSEENGIYHTGNQYERLEAPIHVGIFEEGETAFGLDGVARLHGGYSRRYAQKSLAVFARGRYGASEIDYPLFPDLPYTDYRAFTLRNSGQDWFHTMIRDGLMQTLVEGTAVDGQEYRPAVVYLNGDYWGIHNLRERSNEHYLAQHHGINPDAIDMLQVFWNVPGPRIAHGDLVHYNALIDFVTTASMTLPEDLVAVEQQVDLDNFIDYFASQIYFNNTDWPGNNVKLWRPRTLDGRWRWILFDTDTGFGWRDEKEYETNTLAFATDPNGDTPTNLPESTVLFRRLLVNDEFRTRFVNRFSDLLNSVFAPDHVVAQIDSLVAGIEDEMPRHQQRWPESALSWDDDLERMRVFATNRPAFVMQHLREAFELGDLAAVTIDIEGRGHVRVNQLEPTAFPWTGSYFAGVSVPVEAVPAPGWRFAGWVDEAAEVSRFRLVDPGVLSSLTARFVQGPRATTVVINEVQYNPPDDLDSEDWVELLNPTRSPVDLSNWVFSDEDDSHRFVIPDATVLSAGGYVVLCRDAEAFAAAYPSVEPCLGNWTFGLGGGGDQVRLFDGSGALVDSLAYNDDAPWPTQADGGGATLELVDAGADNTQAASWRASATIGGTPGDLNSVSVSEERSPEISALRLDPGVPNPFRQRVRLRYSVPEPGFVSLRVYDALGREVARLVEERQAEGAHEVTFEPEGLPSGVYLVQLRTSQGAQMQRLTRVR